MKNLKPIFIILFLLTSNIISSAQSIDTIAIRKAQLLIHKKKYTEALSICNKLIASDSSKADYYDTRGEIWFFMSKDVKAVADISHALSIEPNNPLLYYHRGLSLYYSENPDLAIQDCEDAIKHMGEKDTLMHSVILCRADAKEMKRNFSGAIEDYSLPRPENGLHCC